jgi:ADP-ribose pyrophosphatase YjhB (NUDIX family)
VEYWKSLREVLGPAQLILPGADGAVIKDDKILLVKNRDFGSWFLPGGFQDLDESIEETVSREIREETGLSVFADQLISVFTSGRWIKDYPNGHRVQSFILFFRMQGLFDLSDLKLQAEETSDAGFFSPKNLPSPLNEYSRIMIEDLFKYQGKVFFH